MCGFRATLANDLTFAAGVRLTAWGFGLDYAHASNRQWWGIESKHFLQISRPKVAGRLKLPGDFLSGDGRAQWQLGAKPGGGLAHASN